MSKNSDLLLSKLWWSLHEPRAVTFVAICTYLGAIITGYLMVTESVGVLYVSPYHQIHGYIMMSCGILGVPSAWRGRWYLESVSCFGLFGLGFLQMVAGLTDLLGLYDVTVHPVTASWLFGVICWMSFGIARWFRVREQPYAPGSGPLPLERQEELALYLLMSAENHPQNRNGTV